ncbi:Aspartic peptidase domain [Pseudocohnilembus persalinus]|uniref:Aspartic peptidase domain n=1 Tax=Pseudocohnilembus persalinus TaxID=266149 RepID=A0A0V0QLC8_PSEPJ|nr:Aspartic peptidase domain [Pseudocohnilembus persalinus]|eukprot:KRX03139.1 Aspartic peptidase domain [Pseudocohnilembus persalinus]
MLDLCSSASWILTNDTEIQQDQITFQGEYICKPPNCKQNKQFGQESIEAYGNQFEFTQVRKENGKYYTHQIINDKIQINKYIFQNIDLWVPFKQIYRAKNSPYLAKQIHSSFGLGPNYVLNSFNETNNKNNDNNNNYQMFIPFPEQANNQFKTNFDEFSLYYGKKIQKLIIGENQGYFKDPSSNWHFFKNVRSQSLTGTTQNNYALYAPQVIVGEINNKINLKAQDIWNYDTVSHQYAVFDSSTRFIWFGKAELLERIVKEIEVQIKSKCIFEKDVDLYICPEIKEKYPTLTFILTDDPNKQIIDFTSFETFKSQSNHNYLKLQLNQEDYMHKFYNDDIQKEQYYLLLRNGIYGKQNTQLQNLPHIWFGQPLLQKFYTRFFYKDNKIGVTKAYEFDPNQQVLQEKSLLNFKFIALTLLILIIVIGIVLLLTPIKTSKIQYKNIKKIRKNLNQSKQFQQQNEDYLDTSYRQTFEKQQAIYKMKPNIVTQQRQNWQPIQNIQKSQFDDFTYELNKKPQGVHQRGLSLSKYNKINNYQQQQISSNNDLNKNESFIFANKPTQQQLIFQPQYQQPLQQQQISEQNQQKIFQSPVKNTANSSHNYQMEYQEYKNKINKNKSIISFNNDKMGKNLTTQNNYNLSTYQNTIQNTLTQQNEPNFKRQQQQNQKNTDQFSQQQDNIQNINNQTQNSNLATIQNTLINNNTLF